MDKNWPQGYKPRTEFADDYESTTRSATAQMDKDFLSQIDRVDELVSPTEKLDDEVLICECFCVNVADIREACQEIGAFDLEIMQKRFNMGQGCQTCLKRIDSWVNKIF